MHGRYRRPSRPHRRVGVALTVGDAREQAHRLSRTRWFGERISGFVVSDTQSEDA